jgi:hypothetical protein
LNYIHTAPAKETLAVAESAGRNAPPGPVYGWLLFSLLAATGAGFCKLVVEGFDTPTSPFLTLHSQGEIPK